MPIKLKEIKGDLVRFEADFIVNASNTTLKLGSGVSMVLKKHCGAVLQAEMDSIKEESVVSNLPIRQGDVVATSAGNAQNFKYVLHGVVINYDRGVKQFEGKPTLKTIKEILDNTMPYLEWFYRVFKKEPVVIFPYLGCGVGGLLKADVNQVFKRFISQDSLDFDCTIKLCDLSEKQERP
ncbi:MAG: macro domain-containing protein [Thiomicrorhabdus sp.]|nr:macro domain-containing protein [Thiomicrorhabdus sp.]